MPYEKRIVAIFDELYAKHGLDPRTVQQSRFSQQKRFEVLSQITDYTAKSVLEVGCGFGDLADYLQQRFAGVRYTGYDINEKLLSHCRPGDRRRFEKRNILKAPPDERFDVVIAIGCFGNDIGINEQLTRQLLAAMFDCCTELCAFGMSSIYIEGDKLAPDGYSYDPAEIFRYAMTLSGRVNLVHDYMPHDFTIVVKKPPPAT